MMNRSEMVDSTIMYFYDAETKDTLLVFKLDLSAVIRLV